MSSFSWPPQGVIVSEYENYAAFPVTDNDGAVAIALDTNLVYIYHVSSSSWILLNDGAGVQPYPNFAAFPASAQDGQLAQALDTNTLYSYNVGLAGWQTLASPSNTFSVAAFGSSPNNAGGSLAANVLTLQPADETHPGGIAVGAQTLSPGKEILGDGSLAPLEINNSATASSATALTITQKSSSENNAAVGIVHSANGKDNTSALIKILALGAVSSNSCTFSEINYVLPDGASYPFVTGDLHGVYPGVNGVYLNQVSGPGVFPVLSMGGELQSAPAAWAYDSVMMAYSDISSGTNQVFLNENDQIYMGYMTPFTYSRIQVTVNSSEPIEPVFEYYDGSNWVEFYPPLLGTEFSGSYSYVEVYLISAAGFQSESVTVNSVSAYYIRITRTAVTVVTPPTIGTLSVFPYAELSYWNAQGGIRVIDAVVSNELRVEKINATDPLVRVTSTFSGNLTSAQEISVDADGISNNTALSLKYESGALPDIGVGSAVKVKISALNADPACALTGLFVGANVFNPPVCFGYISGPKVYPIYSSGTEVMNLVAAWAYDGMTYSDITSGTNPIFAAVNDEVYIGSDVQFQDVVFTLSTPSSTDLAATYYYWNGASWIRIYVDDNTLGFTQSGDILFVGQTESWATTTINSVDAYYIKIVRTSVVVGTPPEESAISGYSNAGQNYWGPRGDLHIATVAATSTLTGSQVISTVSTGTPPLVVSSTNKVDNLYVDRAAIADFVSFLGVRAYEIDAYGSGGVALITYQNVSYGSGYNTSTGVFTAPLDGYYRVMARVTCNNIAGAFMDLEIYKNGGSVSAQYTYGGVASPSSAMVEDIISCSAGDEIAIYGYTGSGTAIPNTGSALCVLNIVYEGQ